MSHNTTWKRLIIVCVLALVCGVVGSALLLRQPSAELVLSFQSYKTNSESDIMAIVVVSNKGTRTLDLALGAGSTWPPDSYPLTNGPFALPPEKHMMITVALPSEKPRRVVAGAVKDYSSLLGNAWRYLDCYVTERGVLDFYTLEIPE